MGKNDGVLVFLKIYEAHKYSAYEPILERAPLDRESSNSRVSR
jgi:hypothetical protein